MKHILKDTSVTKGNQFISSKPDDFRHFTNDLGNLQSKISDRFETFYVNPIIAASSGNDNKRQLLISTTKNAKQIDFATNEKKSEKVPVIYEGKKVDKGMSYVFIKTGNKLVKVVMESILFIYTDSKNYCSLATCDHKKVSVRSSIQKLAKHLDNDIFVRTHRSYLINWKMVDTIFESDQTLEINGHHIPIGRTYKKDVYAKLNII